MEEGKRGISTPNLIPLTSGQWNTHATMEYLSNVKDIAVTRGNRCPLNIYTVQEGWSDLSLKILQVGEDEEEENQQVEKVRLMNWDSFRKKLDST